jgi:KDO2-lipid IV(A) lauroyltransferase
MENRMADEVRAGELSALPLAAPLLGKVLYYALPIRRRVVLDNMRRVFGDALSADRIRCLAQSHYAHLFTSLVEIVRDGWRTPAQRAALVRVENADICLRAYEGGKGVLLLTGHLGNFEVATGGGLATVPQYRGRFHVLRRPLPKLVQEFVVRRFQRGGISVLPKQGSLDRLLDCLERGDAVAFLLDQYAVGRDAVEVEMFGVPTRTSRSLAIVAMATRAPVVPVASWREADGGHVLRFEEPIEVVRCDDVSEAIRRNTQNFNRTLERLILRHPEQWFWVHRRWK